MYKILFSSSFAVDRFSFVQLYDSVYCTKGHNFRLITPHCKLFRTVFVDRTVNAWNSLPVSAFNHQNVSGFKHFLDDYDLSQFLCQ